MHLPPLQAEQLRLIATESALEGCRELVEEAYICALDAEWQPDVKPSRATLVQLALRGRKAKGSVVLLLDLLSLPQSTSKGFLQKLFRCKSILKVGYGLANDLRAISTALGAQGGSCIAVVQPLIEMRSLTRLLNTSYPSHLPKVHGGLSALVETFLGHHLDKRLQCSAWQNRPLSSEQCAYAALDAACLLGLLERLICLCPPGAAKVPARQRSTHITEIADSQEDAWRAGHEEHANSAASPEARESVAEVRFHRATGSTSRKAISDAHQTDETIHASQADDSSVPGLTALHVSDLQPRGDSRSVDGSGMSEDLACAAREAWGCRLEMSGSTAHVVHKAGHAGHAAADACADRDEQDFEGLPSCIPWRDAGKGHSRTPRFVADVSQEGLARQLRLCGIDTVSAPNLSKDKRFLVHRFLAETAEKEARVILTSDRGFMQRRLCSHLCYFVQASDKKAQLAEVLAAFDLRVDHLNLLSRCVRCNGDFIPRPMTFAELPAASAKQQIPPAVVMLHDANFWVCACCSHTYWRGSQYEKCQMHLAARLNANQGG